MTNDEITRRIDDLLKYRTIPHKALEALRDEIGPPTPEPVHVWVKFYNFSGWYAGVRDSGGIKVVEPCPADEIEVVKPARILAPDEVAVKVPHTDLWPISVNKGEAKRAALVWHFFDKEGACFNQMIAKHGSFNRAEAEEMHRE